MSVYTRMAIGLMVMVLFSLVLLVVIPAYIEKPLFIPGFAPGPDMWPRTIAVMGAVSGTLYVLFQLPEWTHRKPVEGGWLLKTKAYWARGFVSVAVLLAYVELVPILGIIVASTVLLAALYLLLGTRSQLPWMIGLTLAFPYALYWLFTSITTTMFPMGSLWEGLGL